VPGVQGSGQGVTPIDIIETALNAAGKNVKRRGDIITAQCPAHDDGTASLSIGVGTTRDVVIHCHAGCKPDDVLGAVGVKWSDFGTAVTPDAIYPYTDADGTVIYEVVRKPGKKFQQRQPTGAGDWEWNLKGVERTLYRLPKVLAAAANGDTVYICEGEKDVERLEAEGVTATCNSGGAGSFEHRFGLHLRGANVVIIADRDEPGVNHANDVARACAANDVPYRIVQAAKGKDASDHFTFGGTIDTLVALEAPGNEPTEEAWPEPVPLIGQRECPPFPVHVLPDWMAAQAIQVAEEMQYPPDLPAQLAITAASMCISRRVTVQVDGPWVEGTNIYTVTAMNASAGKSPAVKHMFGAIRDYEVDLIEASAKIVEDRELERKMIEKDIADALKRGDGNQASTFGDDLRAKPPIAKPRLVAEDITPEKLAMVMADQGGRMALVSTEGGVFQIMAGRYTDASNLDIFLQGWSGDDITQDRVGRESLVIRDARLTVALTVQPIVIAQIGENGEFAGRGLLARFMYSIPANTVGKRDKRRRSTWDAAIADRYARKLTELARRFTGDDCLPQLRLSDEAHAVFVDWQQGHEDRMGYNGDLEHLAEWVSKMHSSVCRLAGVIHMAEREYDTTVGTTPDISEETMLRAMVVGDYWVAHARIAGDLWGADPEVDKALRLLRWAEKRRDEDGDVFTIRDAMRGLRKLFPKAEAAIPALQILTESGWIRADMPISEWGRGRGGQSALFTLRPATTTHSVTCGQVVTHVTHVPKGVSEFTHSLITDTGMAPPSDMGDMGDNPPTTTNPTTTTDGDGIAAADPETFPLF
jgi:putative DNA primase/helicase